MKTLDTILSERRSIRKFNPEATIDNDTINAIIGAAIEAPSWKNQQTSRYHVVVSPEAKSALLECLHPINQQTVKDASALVVTTFVKDRVGFDRQGTPDNELGNGWGIYDLGLHNAFFLIKAAELGVDTIVLGLRDADAIRRTLNIPEQETIVAVIGLGQRAEDATVVRPKRKTVEDITVFY